MKLLLVEDDTKIATAVTRGLDAEGFAVEVAADGADGLWMATEGRYDLIVLDIMLPGRNGYEVCADLRAGRRLDADPDADGEGRRPRRGRGARHRRRRLPHQAVLVPGAGRPRPGAAAPHRRAPADARAAPARCGIDPGTPAGVVAATPRSR